MVSTIGWWTPSEEAFAVARRVRRFWSEDEKRRIVAQTWAPGVSVSQVGRRYDVNANLIFKWRRDPRFRRAGDGEAETSFLPVEVVPEPLSRPSVAPAALDGRKRWRWRAAQRSCARDFQGSRRWSSRCSRRIRTAGICSCSRAAGVLVKVLISALVCQAVRVLRTRAHDASSGPPYAMP